jgi:hypothetical protein
MKLLKIENSIGYYLNDQGAFSSIDKITKEDLLRLVGLTLSEAIELDEYDELAIKNQAHQILYRSIFEKLNGLGERQQEFTDESARLYLQEYERYRDKPSQQRAEGDTVNRAP